MDLLMILGIIGVLGIILVFVINRRSFLRSLAGICAILVAVIFSYQLFFPLARGVSIYSLKWMVLLPVAVPLLVYVVLQTTYSVFSNFYSKRPQTDELATAGGPAEPLDEAAREPRVYVLPDGTHMVWESAIPPKGDMARAGDDLPAAIALDEALDEDAAIALDAALNEDADATLNQAAPLAKYAFATLSFAVLRRRRPFEEDAFEREISSAQEAHAAEVAHIMEEAGFSAKARPMPKTLPFAVVRRRHRGHLEALAEHEAGLDEDGVSLGGALGEYSDIYYNEETRYVDEHNAAHEHATHDHNAHEAHEHEIHEIRDIHAHETHRAEERRAHETAIFERAVNAKAENDFPLAELLFKEFLCETRDEREKLRARELLLECYIARKAFAEAKLLAQSLQDGADEALAAKMRVVLKYLR